MQPSGLVHRSCAIHRKSTEIAHVQRIGASVTCELAHAVSGQEGWHRETVPQRTPCSELCDADQWLRPEVPKNVVRALKPRSHVRTERASGIVEHALSFGIGFQLVEHAGMLVSLPRAQQCKAHTCNWSWCTNQHPLKRSAHPPGESSNSQQRIWIARARTSQPSAKTLPQARKAAASLRIQSSAETPPR